MDSKKLFNFILILTMAECVLTDVCDPSLQQIINYMKSYLSTYQVTVVLDQSQPKLGLFGSNIMKVMIDEFSSVVVDDGAIKKISDTGSSTKLWDEIADQSKLKVGIVEIHDEQEVLLEMRLMIFYMKAYSRNVRGKCIIFLINGRGQSLEPFLRFAWSRDFLDLTVVEWVNKTQTRIFPATENLASEVLVHIFDPFQDKYTKERLSPNTDIFPRKTRNLHDYHLQMQVHVDRRKPGKLKTERDLALIFCLEEVLNFTIVYRYVEHDEKQDRIPPGDISENDAIPQQRADFYFEFFHFWPESNITNGGVKMNDVKIWLSLAVPTSVFEEIQLTIMQKKTTEVEISLNFLKICGVLVVMCLIFLLSSRMMKFDERSWSTVKIAQALLGGPLETRRRIRLGEKILLVTLYFVSIVMMTLTSDELIKMSINKHELLGCTTLEQLADSSTHSYTLKSTKDILLSYSGKDNPKLQKIIDKSILVGSARELLSAAYSDASHNSVYGTLERVEPNNPHVIKFRPGIYLTQLRDTIATKAEYMPVRMNFPLRERFVKVLSRLSETGLIMYHETQNIGHMHNVWARRGLAPQMYPNYEPENDKDEEVFLNLRLLIILVPGYVLGCVVLIWEIFFQSQRPVQFEKLNSKRKRFVRCLVEEAKSKIIKESSCEFDFIQVQLRIMTLGQWEPNNSSRSSVKSKIRKENEDREIMFTEDRPRVFGLLGLDNAHLIAHLKRKRRTSITLISHDGQSTANLR
ncbi:hypothetical protein QAD02_010931 [Eretmocerus hayati]|uniref:Uncharacterized protein n=1 Tax=Eretmocerus hayati TaxID=131215 RepID=A0ACC2NV90_9HYME|nr:hypothetical protein QAD02_010931 [Eretmocerus hayati]